MLSGMLHEVAWSWQLSWEQEGEMCRSRTWVLVLRRGIGWVPVRLTSCSLWHMAFLRTEQEAEEMLRNVCINLPQGNCSMHVEFTSITSSKSITTTAACFDFAERKSWLRGTGLWRWHRKKTTVGIRPGADTSKAWIFYTIPERCLWPCTDSTKF